MKGKILSYDSKKGIGRIITSKKQIKTFTAKDLINNIIPEVGLEVTFEIEDGKLRNIDIEDIYTLVDTVKKEVFYTPPKELNIKETVSLNECLDNFFKKYFNVINKYQSYLNSPKTLPYKKIKRFIFTAYNNLVEIDTNINDKHLLSVKNSLEELEFYYDSLIGDIKYPSEILLDKIFLKKQLEFQSINKKFEVNKKIISENLSKSKSLEGKIKQLEIELKSLSPKSDIYIQKEAELKGYKKNYVDLIDKAQTLKDENATLIKDIVLFKEFYKELFKDIFIKKTKMLSKVLIKELDSIAYECDTILWKNAKASKAIQHFFKDAKIEGSYSTKTFMKYYLKNLNTEKMNNKDNELVEIFNELKLLSKSVVIYNKNRSHAREITLEIENLDHDTDVKIFNIFKEFILYIKENSTFIDIIILHIEENIVGSISKIMPIFSKLGIKAILYSDNIKADNIIKTKDLYKELRNLI